MKQLVELSPDDRARLTAKVLLAWHDVTATEAAEHVGCTQSAMSMKLAGVRPFRLDELVKLAGFLGEDPGLFVRPDLERLLSAPRKRSSGQSPSAESGSYPRRSGWSHDRFAQHRLVAPVPQADAA